MDGQLTLMCLFEWFDLSGFVLFEDEVLLVEGADLVEEFGEFEFVWGLGLA